MTRYLLYYIILCSILAPGTAIFGQDERTGKNIKQAKKIEVPPAAIPVSDNQSSWVSDFVHTGFAGFIGGSLVAVIVSIYFSLRQERINLSEQLIQSYISSYYLLHVQVTNIFDKSPDCWEEPEKILVRQMGDWFEIVALLYNSNRLNIDLINKSDITNFIVCFLPLATNEKAELSLSTDKKQWNEMRKIYKTYRRQA